MTPGAKAIPNTTPTDITPATSPFEPISSAALEPVIHLPEELWLTVLQCLCSFPPDIFADVMLNLIKNPNITSSYLFRADLYYDSETDYTLERLADGSITSRLLKQVKSEYHPRPFCLDGYHVTRTIVRRLVPRNPQLDDSLVQTCHFLSKSDGQEETTAVVYIPHVQTPEDMPFYHPLVSRILFCHNWRSSSPAESSPNPPSPSPGSISISYSLFPHRTMTTKLERTALRLLQTIHKHGQGQLAGYEKRVHLDQIIPQKRYQDTYTRLKAKYGKHLTEQWVEVTDPGKHVFEDISIAAFLIELWRDMYTTPLGVDGDTVDGATREADLDNSVESKPRFPGFVDIGCGNGVLVYLLLSEGYTGSGFDARARKTWQIFPEGIQQKLQRRILVPEVFHSGKSANSADAMWHDGVFDPGTFIISNHADELTAWTPVLAYLNQSAFVAIPCCSHDFTGARFRAPATVKAAVGNVPRLPQQDTHHESGSQPSCKDANTIQAAETGSLRRAVVQKKMQSAFSTLCSYVASLAEELGYVAEREVLRIPSTRNQCIIGRRWAATGQDGEHGGTDRAARRERVVGVIERELKMDIDTAASTWIGKVEKLSIKPASGH